MKVDLCVFLAGQHLDEYAPLFLETLQRNCDLTDLTVHVVEKGGIHYTGPPQGPDESPWYTDLLFKYYVPGVGDNVHEYLLRKQQEMNLKIYEKHDAREFFTQSTPLEPFWHFGDDHGNTLNWAIKNCGTAKWVIFCHSDIVFRKDMVSRHRESMNDWMGVFGIWNHCYVVNRTAFFGTGARFNCITNFRAMPVHHNGFDVEIHHAEDPRCNLDEAQIVYGWDVGEHMEMMMWANQWENHIINPARGSISLEDLETLSYVDHMCSGHGYANEETRKHQAGRRAAWFGEFGIARI